MAQTQMASITCGQCNASYNSENALRDHMRTAHRAFAQVQALPPSSGQADGMKHGDEERKAAKARTLL